MPTTSVIIPTYKRPDDLRACIQSVLQQTVTPTELLVIDDGDLQSPPLQPECEAAGIRYIYYKKDAPGRNASRNIGIDLSSGEIVFFLDDDVILYPDFVEEMLKPYADDPEQRIGGVGGLNDDDSLARPSRRLRHWLHVLFLVEGAREGRVLPSGFCTELGAAGRDPPTTVEVDFLPGGISSFRRRVLDEFRFTEKYNRIAIGEDKEFSYRVSRKYKLLTTPCAKLCHVMSSAMRPDPYATARQSVFGHYHFFYRHVRRGWWSWLLFYYALFGYTAVRMGMTLVRCNRSELLRMKGMLSAVLDIARGRAPSIGSDAA